MSASLAPAALLFALLATPAFGSPSRTERAAERTAQLRRQHPNTVELTFGKPVSSELSREDGGSHPVRPHEAFTFRGRMGDPVVVELKPGSVSFGATLSLISFEDELVANVPVDPTKSGPVSLVRMLPRDAEYLILVEADSARLTRPAPYTLTVSLGEKRLPFPKWLPGPRPLELGRELEGFIWTKDAVDGAWVHFDAYELQAKEGEVIELGFEAPLNPNARLTLTRVREDGKREEIATQPLPDSAEKTGFFTRRYTLPASKGGKYLLKISDPTWTPSAEQWSYRLATRRSK
jgi:hypothetical protein